MKHTQIVELLKNIRATGASFFSVLLFVAISVAIFCGISWTGPALQASITPVIQEGNLHDFEIAYPYGITDEDLEELKALGIANQAEGGYTAYQTVKYNGSDTMKLMSLTTTVDTPVRVQGRLPEKAGEIAVNSTWANKLGVQIGEELTFKHDGGKKDANGMKYLLDDTYTVTAILDTPAYMGTSKWTYGVAEIGGGTIDCLGWVTQESFDRTKFQGYPQAYVTCNALADLDPFSKEYEQAAEEVYDRLTQVGEDMAVQRFQALKAEGQQKLDEAASELQEAENKIGTAKSQIAAGQKELAAGKAELAEGKQTLDTSLAKLREAEALYEETETTYASMQTLYGRFQTLTEAETAAGRENAVIVFETYGMTQEQVVADMETYGDLLEELKLTHLLDRHAQATEEIRAGITAAGLQSYESQFEEELAAVQERLDLGEKYLNLAWAEYDKGLAQYRTGQQKVAAGERTLASKKQQLEKAITSYDEKSAQLEEEQQALDTMEAYSWTILSRDGSGGIQVIQTYSNVTGDLRYSMALMFLVIGLLVSYSAMSRIVKDQIISLGTKKALGLRSREIICSYLLYAGLAVFVGCGLGFLGGIYGVQPLVAARLGNRFITGTYGSVFVAKQGLLLMVVELVLILATTWVACRNILRMQAVDLLKGPKPPAGKRRFFESWTLWKRLSLLNKTIVNNCLNDKQRVTGTIIGVAGCTALLVSSLSFTGNLEKTFTSQYEDIYHFDTIVRYNPAKKNAQGQVEERLDELSLAGTPVHMATFGVILPDGKQSFIKMTVPHDTETFGDFYTAVPQEDLVNPAYADGVWLNAAFAEHFDVEEGDPISIIDSTGQKRTFTIEGFFPYHLISYEMILSEGAYEEVMSSGCKANAFLVDSQDHELQEIRDAMKEVKGYLYVKDDYQAAETAFQDFLQVSGIIMAIYLVLSVVMAIVVLLNLNIVSIEEKKRELIILMINGFSVRDAKGYIYRDSIALTLIGVILGIAFGCVMSSVAMMTLEPNNASFIQSVNWKSCLMGAGISCLLSLAMSLIALRRVSSFSLSDINKA